MTTLPASRSIFGRRKRFRGQGLVEFALILPVMLIVIFVIIELARVLHAWLAVENGARFGVRYAVTGEYNESYCIMFGHPDDECWSQDEQDGARIPSIKDSARSGSVAILRDETLLPGEPRFYKVTVCSNKAGVVYFPPDPDTSTPADCQPSEDPGGPGDRVSVTVDFDHPLIAPIISSLWPKLHLTAKREGIVEQFRVARVVGLPATISLPSFTPSDTLPPTETLTSTITSTVTETNTETATATITQTATRTPTPDCSNIYISSMWISGGDEVRARVVNDNDADAYLYWTRLRWDDVPYGYVDWFRFPNQYYGGNDYSSPTTVDGTWVWLGGNSNETWRADFDGEPPEGIYGDFTLTLRLEYPDWGICEISRSIWRARPPTPTPTRTATWGPSPTRTRTRTPRPSRTPTRTATWGPSPTRTKTRTVGPTRTRTATEEATPTTPGCGMDC